jgi:hypothetical protein
MSIDDTADGASGNLLSAIYNAFNCWVSGVRGVDPGRSHVQFSQTAHDTVMNSYFYLTKGMTSSSYGVESFNFFSDNLVSNNIYQDVASPQMTQLDTGTVRAFNFDVLDLYCENGTVCNSPSGSPFTTAGGPMGLTTTNHDPGVAWVLWEGNISPGFKPDIIHGSGGLQTFFRNNLYGWANGPVQARTPIQVFSYNRAENVVANVLGRPGIHNVYQSQVGSFTTTLSIYDLGYGNGLPNDALVAGSLLRWGNWDAVTNGTRWCGKTTDTNWAQYCAGKSEAPGNWDTGTSLYPNNVPTVGDTAAGQLPLPTSFAFASKPSWWPSGKAWPAIGPDVTGGNLLACTSGTYNGYLVTSSSQCAGGASAPALNGMVNSIPAMDCYLNTMSGPPDGSGGVLTFNAGSCYPTTQTTAPPQTLTAAIH